MTNFLNKIYTFVVAERPKKVIKKNISTYFVDSNDINCLCSTNVVLRITNNGGGGIYILEK